MTSLVLVAEHIANRTDTLSYLILAYLNIDSRKIVRNENGEQNNFTLRNFDPFLALEPDRQEPAQFPLFG